MKAFIHFKISKAILSKDGEELNKAIEVFDKLKDAATAKSLTNVMAGKHRVRHSRFEEEPSLKNVYKVEWQCFCQMHELQPFLECWNAIEAEEYPFTSFVLHI